MHRLVLKGSKLVLFQPRVSFLGYILAGDGIRPQNEKLDATRRGDCCARDPRGLGSHTNRCASKRYPAEATCTSGGIIHGVFVAPAARSTAAARTALACPARGG